MLGPSTHMYDVQSDKVIDEKGPPDELGYTPQQAVEILSDAMGDATDNVQGIPGVGEKTALKLIQKYGPLMKSKISTNSRPKCVRISRSSAKSLLSPTMTGHIENRCAF